ncbi:hypothetical protein F5B21DRAFT_464460 [Xylaria acuta]|nr:hypothetical protein F5B21DRAFT_464460 [Xylaria acuta]
MASESSCQQKVVVCRASGCFEPRAEGERYCQPHKVESDERLAERKAEAKRREDMEYRRANPGKDIGACNRCGRSTVVSSSDVGPEGLRCERCIVKQKTALSYQRSRYHRIRSQGLCKCGEKAINGRSQCSSCTAMVLKRRNRLAEADHCRCGRPRDDKGYLTCSSCRAKHQKARKDNRLAGNCICGKKLAPGPELRLPLMSCASCRAQAAKYREQRKAAVRVAEAVTTEPPSDSPGEMQGEPPLGNNAGSLGMEISSLLDEARSLINETGGLLNETGSLLNETRGLLNKTSSQKITIDSLLN